MSKREQVRTIRRQTPVKTFLAHWGIFLTAFMLLELTGYIVVYPKPVTLTEAKSEGGILSSLGM